MSNVVADRALAKQSKAQRGVTANPSRMPAGSVHRHPADLRMLAHLGGAERYLH